MLVNIILYEKGSEMSMSKITILFTIVLLSSFSFYTSVAGTFKPDKAENFHADILRMTPLKGEIPNVKDFSLRMRLITIEPGGHTSFHVHKNRPGIVYIVSGSIINHEEGKPPKRISAGEIFYETQEYAHYIENKGTVSATLISADIVASETE